ncbi:MAG: substrate-binding domain-containing protein, partial [Mangrovimonas sp.]|nr:substrate-binding domain-containing protein [Mangrovimonas sp.]
RKLGKEIPDDIQVIGFTDGVLSKHAIPGLTTVSQHGQRIGEKAAELLIERIENEYFTDNFQTVVVETELIERESTK